MKRKSPFWLIGTAGIMFVGLIAIQIIWVFDAAQKQEEHFNQQIEFALARIEANIEKDKDLLTTVDCCLTEDKNATCKPYLSNDDAWIRTDVMIANELEKTEIDLNYNFDFCYADPSKKDKFEYYEQNMDKVFEDSGIVLFLEFPDKSKFLRNQIGPVFISAILMIVFLSILFAVMFRFYKKERGFSSKNA